MGEFKYLTTPTEYLIIGCPEDKIERHYQTVLDQFNKKYNTDCKVSIKFSDSHGQLSMCKSGRILIICDDELIGKITFTGQNNCCGSISIHELNVNYHYRSRGLGNLLLNVIEDLAWRFRKTSIICTEIIVDNIGTSEEYGYSTLKSNLKDYVLSDVSHKLLLRNNYELVNTFMNRKSFNVVGYFIKTLGEKAIQREIKSNIQMSKESFVKIDKFTIGGDPEGFFVDSRTGDYVPSFSVMGGTKEEPLPISNEGHAIQCDNVMLEYNIPPSDNADDFVKHNLFVQNYLADKIAIPNGLELRFVASARFKEENLQGDKALEMGCSPDYNAYSGAVNHISDELIKDTLRTAGGHVAIGYNDHNYNSNMMLIRFLDLFVSIPLILMEPDSERKKLYGKAGAFRNTRFGVEYRVTSNYVYSSEEMMRWLFEAVSNAIAYYNTKADLTEDCNLIIEAINSKDEELAIDLMEKHGVTVPERMKV